MKRYVVRVQRGRMNKLFFTVCFLFGCANPTTFQLSTDINQQIAMDVTIDVWESYFGYLDEHSYFCVESMYVEILPVEAVKERRGDDHIAHTTLIAQRNTREYTRIYVVQEDPNRFGALVHECIHVIQWCLIRKKDFNHSCVDCWENQSGEKSIEFKAQKILQEL